MVIVVNAIMAFELLISYFEISCALTIYLFFQLKRKLKGLARVCEILW
jgi:hypothetical protein